MLSPAFHNIKDISDEEIHDDQCILTGRGKIQEDLIDTDVWSQPFPRKIDITQEQLMGVCVRNMESPGNLSTGQVDVFERHDDL